MIIGIPKEIMHEEARVAATPDSVKKYIADGHKVLVEKGAGIGALHADEAYAAAGAVMCDTAQQGDDEAELIITEKERYSSFIAVKNKKGEKLRLKSEEIIFIESFGHEVVVHSTDGEPYYAYDRLYQLCTILDNEKFLRVSNCAIIAKSHVKKIKPSLSMKFVLTMSDGSLVDVTRSYCNSFKEFFGI